MDPLTDVVLSYLKELVGAFRKSKSPVFLREETIWEKDSSGIARRRTVNQPHLGIFLHTYKDRSSLYPSTAQAIAADPDFAPAVGSLVGDQSSLSQFNEDTVISTASRGMVQEDGSISLRKSRVSREIAKLRTYIKATHREETVVIPLPGLKSYKLPFVIGDGVEIDSLTEEEISACVAASALRPMHGDFPMLRAEECIGARITIRVPAEIITPEQLDANQEERTRRVQEESTKAHKFGDPSRWHLSEMVDDVLFVLRLARPEFIGTQGAVVLSQNHMGNSRSWIGRPTRQFVMTSFELDKATGKTIRSTWKAMKAQAGKKRSLPSICVRRFTAALDRISLDDAVIDHLIAAEALFLKDAGAPEDRGELGFRLSLRAAVFLEKDASEQIALRKFVKKAYDIRSGIAHGGPADSQIKVPDRTPAVPLHEFVDELGAVMRRSFIKAIALYSSDPSFGKPEYWERLIIHD